MLAYSFRNLVLYYVWEHDIVQVSGEAIGESYILACRQADIERLSGVWTFETSKLRPTHTSSKKSVLLQTRPYFLILEVLSKTSTS